MSMFKQFFVMWIVILCFLSVLAAQVDGTIQATWFIVFIPLFILDAVKLVFLLFHIYMHMRDGSDSLNLSMSHKLTALTLWLLILVFQILLCVYLDGQVKGMTLYFTFIPLWIVLIIQGIALNRYQLDIARNSPRSFRSR